jgi:hypothetical protein
MTYFIFARDGASRIILKRESRETAEKRARELEDLGWFEVQIVEVDGPNEVTSRMVYWESA